MICAIYPNIGCNFVGIRGYRWGILHQALGAYLIMLRDPHRDQLLRIRTGSLPVLALLHRPLVHVRTRSGS